MKHNKKRTLAALSLLIITSYTMANHDEVKKPTAETHQGHQHSAEHQGHDNHAMHADHQHQHAAAEIRIVTGRGLVNSVMADHQMLNISHEPIQELNWPKMKMNFNTKKEVDLSGVKPGQEIEFTMEVDKNQKYIIKAVKLVN